MQTARISIISLKYFLKILIRKKHEGSDNFEKFSNVARNCYIAKY